MQHTLRLVVLSENRSLRSDLAAEHGLAIWVEYRGRTILYDTGQSTSILANARHLGIDLSQLGDMVLSHGHYDHTGGLAGVLGMADKADVWIHPEAVVQRYAVRPGAPVREIGMPADSLAALREYTSRVRFTKGIRPLMEGVTLINSVVATTDFETPDPVYSLDRHGTRTDLFSDEQSLVFTCPRGLVVLVGCAHVGVVNILQQIREVFPDDAILAVIGGMHLSQAGDARKAETLQALQAWEIGAVYPGHCTGEDMEARIQEAFAGRGGSLFAGMEIRF